MKHAVGSTDAQQVQTPEQDAAEQELMAAMQAYARAFDIDTEYVGDWLAVVESPRLDEVGSPYQLLLAGGKMPMHRVIGLLAVGHEIAGSQWNEEE